MKRIRPTMLLLLTGILIVLVFFGTQLKVPTAFAYPSYATFDATSPTSNTCARSGCHTGTTSPTGAVITFPSGMTSYTPGGPAIPLTITVPGKTYQTWGFQLNARLSTNLSSAGGFFTAGDNGTTSAFGPSSTFNVNWTPPPAGTTASVNFYLTGNNTSSFSTSNLFSTGMYTLTPAAAAPAADFSLSASPTSLTVTQGASGTSTISVAALNGFTGSVGLSATGMPSGVTATFSPVSKTGTSTLTLAASSATATGTSTVTIKGTSGALSHSTTLSLTVNAPAPAPDFSLLASPYTLTQGGNGTSTITVNPLNGFTGSVTLSASNVPSGVTASAFNPASTGSTSVLTLSASSTATAGTYYMTITGTSGSLTHTAMLSLTVIASTPAPNFSLSASPYTLTQGGNGTSTITVTPQYNFSGSVMLSVSGLPSGVTASAFNPASTTSTSVLTLSATSTAATGTYSVTITGTSGSLTHMATLNLTVMAASVPDFRLSAMPSSLTVTQGASGTSTITVAPSGGFTGSVALSASGVPSGVTATFSSPSTMSTSMLTLAASSTATTGNSLVTITGTSGGLTHTATITLTVNSTTSNSTMIVSPTSLTFNYQSGSSTSGSQSLTITSSGWRYYYSASTSGGPWLTVSPTSGRTPGTITVSVNASSMSSGTYSGTIQVWADDVGSKTIPVTLNVTSSSTCTLNCGGTTTTIYAAPYVTDPTSSGGLYAQWINHIGVPTGNPTSPFDPGLELSKNATAPSGSFTGAYIRNIQPGSPIPTEIGFDYREGGQCTTTSPRIVIVGSMSGTHALGCSTGTITTPTMGTGTTAVPIMGWKRVRFNMSAMAQAALGFVPGDTITSITLIQDQAPDPAVQGSAGGLVIIDNIDINGTFAGKGSYTSTGL